jgi:hypothetical protein
MHTTVNKFRQVTIERKKEPNEALSDYEGKFNEIGARLKCPLDALKFSLFTRRTLTCECEHFKEVQGTHSCNTRGHFGHLLWFGCGYFVICWSVDLSAVLRSVTCVVRDDVSSLCLSNHGGRTIFVRLSNDLPVLSSEHESSLILLV